MAKQPESRLQMKIRKALIKEVGGWWFKVWGGPFQQAGIPDIIGSVQGHFFAFEVKTPTGSASDIQLATIESIKKKGGGVACVITTPEAAVRAVKKRLEAAGLVPKASNSNRAKGRDLRSVYGAGDRKDLGDRRGDRKADRPRLLRGGRRSPHKP